MKILKYLVILIAICVAATFCSNVFPVNADPANTKDLNRQAITNILWMHSSDLFRPDMPPESVAEQLTPELISEDKIILDITKEVNEQIPVDTIVTSETVETTVNRIEKIIEKAGYLVNEYSTRISFCPAGHIHYVFIINAKTRPGQYTIEAQYFFKMIELKIPIKPNTI